MRWISSLPGVSAGWALPANTNCTGRSASCSSAPQAVGVATAAASPACRWRSGGRSRWSARVGSSTSAPRRWRARRTSSSRPSFSVAHASSGSTSRTRAQRSASAPSQSSPTTRVSSASTRADAHVRPCTPLVIEPIGTSSTARSGHRPLEHLPADGAVQAGDAVRAGGQAQAHHGHVELVRPARRRAAPRANSSSNVDAALGGEVGEVLGHQRRAGSGRCRPAPACGS